MKIKRRGVEIKILRRISLRNILRKFYGGVEEDVQRGRKNIRQVCSYLVKKDFKIVMELVESYCGQNVKGGSKK